MNDLKFVETEDSLKVDRKVEVETKDLKGNNTVVEDYEKVADIPKNKEIAQVIVNKIIEKIIRPKVAEPPAKSISQKMDEVYDR
jgi:CRISPR/Cas system-associated endonuclease Cas3-HD